MDKKKKEIIKANFSMNKQIFEALSKFCEETGRTKTKVVEIAIEKYIEKHKNEME